MGDKKMNIVELAEKFEKGEISMNDEAYKKASDALAKMANAEQYTEIAQLVTQYIEDDYNEFDIIPEIFEVKNFRLGDEPLFKTHKKGIVAYETAPNAYVPKSENYEVEYTMKFTNLGVRPTCLLQDLKTGRVDSLAALIRDAKEARHTKRMAMVWELLAQTYNATSNKENYFKGNTLTKEILDKAINRVRKKTGMRPIIIGDYDLLTAIEKFEGFSALEPVYTEVRNNGLLGMYRGCKLVYLPEILDKVTGESIVPTDKIMVVGKKIGYAGTKGDLITEQEKDIDDMSWSCRIDQRIGQCITKPYGLAVVHLTDQ